MTRFFLSADKFVNVSRRVNNLQGLSVKGAVFFVLRIIHASIMGKKRQWQKSALPLVFRHFLPDVLKNKISFLLSREIFRRTNFKILPDEL